MFNLYSLDMPLSYDVEVKITKSVNLLIGESVAKSNW
jgi:hypothetical protein